MSGRRARFLGLVAAGALGISVVPLLSAALGATALGTSTVDSTVSTTTASTTTTTAADGFGAGAVSAITVAAGGQRNADEPLHLNPLPKKADIVLSFDTTGSMGPALSAAKTAATSIVQDVQAPGTIPGARFAVTEFQDYGGATAYQENLGSNVNDRPYVFHQALTTDAAAVTAAIPTTVGLGGDDPEAYNRAIFESYSDGSLGYDPAATKLLILFGDQIGHDASPAISGCPATGPTDPGRDGIFGTTDAGTNDDLPTKTVLDGLKRNNIKLLWVSFTATTAPTNATAIEACQQAMVDYVDGVSDSAGSGLWVAGGTSGLESTVVNLITTAAAHINSLQASVANGTEGDPADPASWVSFQGLPASADVGANGTDFPLQAVVRPTSDATPGTYPVNITVSADGVRTFQQSLAITVKTPLSNVALNASPATIGAGIDQVPLPSIPPSWLSFQAGSTASAPVGSTPVGSTPVGSTPVGSTPVGSTPVGSTPVGSTPVGSTPVGSTPVGSTGLFDAPVGSTPVGSTAFSTILLSQIQLNGTSWDQILCGSLRGQPLEALTLLDLANSTETCTDGKTSLAHFKALTFKQVDLSTTLFRSVHWSSIVAGNTPLSAIPLPTGQTGWCTGTKALPALGGSCAGIGDDSASVLQVDIAGQLGSAPVGSTPVGSTPVGSTPVGSTPVGSTAITASKLAAIPLSTIGHLSAVVNCAPTGTYDCTGKTLGDAYTAHVILPGATFADIADAMATAQLTVNDVLVAILGAAGLPWEQLPVQGLQPFSLTKPTVGYAASATVDCSVAPSFGFRVTLPDGFFPVAGSAKLSLDGGTTSTAVTDGPTLVDETPPPAITTAVVNRSPTTNTYEWTLSCGDGNTATAVNAVLTFNSYVGLHLGQATASAKAFAVNFVTDPATKSVSVGQNGEPNDTPDTATAIKPDTLVVGHIAVSGDQDFYQVSLTQSDGTPLPRGEKVSVFLKVPTGTDFDLSISKPAAASFFSTPVGSTPVGSTPIEDHGVGFANTGLALPSETLQDVPVGSTPVGSTPVGSTPVGSTSTTRGDANEAAQIISDGSGGVATIDVTGYNGATSGDPYVLRVQETPPPPVPPNCPARTFAYTPGTAPTLPASLPAATKTLFIVNTQQLNALYGAASVNTLLGRIGDQGQSGTFAARPEVMGSVLKVDGATAVQGAYRLWNGTPCDPTLANNVVRSINDVVASYRTSATGLPNLHYIVLLGTDEALPMARTFDPVTLSPEENEAADLAFTSPGLTNGNALYNSAAGNNILTDGAYGAFQSIPWLGRDLLLPQLSVSRLVETPTDMLNQVNQYLATSGSTNVPQSAAGTLNPTSALVTGYDFLADGAKAVHDNLRAQIPGLLTPFDTFSSGDLSINDPATTTAPWTKADVTSSFLAPLSNNPPSIASLNAHYNHYELQAANHDLASTADVGALNNVVSRILFTMGCHGGLNVADTLGGTGGKYLDWAQEWASQPVAIYIANTGFGYGDSASVALSERLLSLYAKNLRSDSNSVGEEWAQTLSQYFATAGAYDVYDEKVMEETTFYGLPFWHFAGAPTSPTPVSLATTTDSVLGTQSATVAAPLTSSSSATQFGLYRPTLPIASTEVTSTLPARGIWITALSTDDGTGDVSPNTGMPTIDQASHEPKPNVRPIFFPASPFTLERSMVFGKERDFVNVSDQFRPDPASPGQGRQRKVTAGTNLEILYSNSADRVAPLISQVGVAVAGGSASISVRATDDVGVKAVTALLHDGSGPWTVVKLVQSTADPTLWTGAHAVAGDPEVFVEATDGVNVGYSANKGSNFTSTSSTNPTGPQILVAAPVGPYAINQPVNASYQCMLNGVALPAAQCIGTRATGQPLDTSSFGSHTFVVRAFDSSGVLIGSLQRTYVVAYAFKGFFQPIDNEPTFNTVKAGLAVPIKFSLSGNQGLDIFAAGYPKSQQIACDASAPADGVETTLTAGSSSLSYDPTADQYNYVWKTDSSWANSCRALIVKLKDGSTRRADFKFTK